MSGERTDHPEALLAAYVVDDLPPGERQAVADHLAGCARCRTRLRSLKATALLLRQLPTPTAPRSFVLSAATAPRPLRSRPFAAPSFLVAAAVLILALGVSLGLSGGSAARSAARAPRPEAAARAVVNSAAESSAGATVAAGAALSGAAAPAARGPVAAAPVTQPPRAVASSASPAPPPTRRVAPYQVALAIGGLACLALAVVALLRGRRFRRYR